MVSIIDVCLALAVASSIKASEDTKESHCFRRVSSGERLIAHDVTRIVERTSVQGCEEECNIYKCTHFSFGAPPGGNDTCELTTDRQVSRRQDPDFELYEKTNECAEGKPKGYEAACYRRIATGKRLRERFIRHSLPCNSLEACQHQCSIEKHFDCQGFNIRLDPAGVGRGICELSSVAVAHLEPSRDFVFDPEFVYYERDHGNESPNCGHIHQTPNVIPPHHPEENTIGYKPPASGGPYYGGDSYGPWSTGHGTVDHGPWGSHGYGSGFYESNNPSRGPVPSFPSETPFRQDPYDYAGGGRYPDYPPTGPNYPNYSGGKPLPPTWTNTPPPSKYPFGDRRYDRPNRIPTYIIIDADARAGGYGNDVQPKRPDLGYLPSRPSRPPALPPPPPPRPLPPPPRLPPPPPPPPPSNSVLKPFGYYPPGPPERSFGMSHNTIGHEVCFRREHPGYRLDPSTIKGTYDAPSVMDCESLCSQSPFKCTGYSFRYSSGGRGAPNCLLTDFASIDRETHLLPDRSCDVYFKMGMCAGIDRMGDTECFVKVASNRKIEPNKVAQSVSVRGMSDCELACLNSKFFTCRSFSFRHGPGVIGEPFENCFLSDWPISALAHSDFVPLASHEVYERGSFGHGCELDAGPPHIGPVSPLAPHPNLPQGTRPKAPWAVDETWRHFTVSGWPCRAGTECQLNPKAGFWACEVEGGDRAQWDYCCRPKHSCGFSRGFHYPWCYVGEAGPEQWRPCSEYYYPDFDNRQPYKPVQSHNPPPVDSYGPPTNKRPWNFGEDYGPPSFWPISYIYAEPPPNETYAFYAWDPEEQHGHPHHPLPDSYQEYLDDGPRIKFKPCPRKSPYPRAIIQKLDLKDIPKAASPGEQLRLDDHPRHAKKVEPPQEKPDSGRTFGFSPENRDKESLKNEIEVFFNGTEDVFSSKRELQKEEITTEVSANRTKQVIKAVEEIIQQSSARPPAREKEPKKETNETLTKAETKYPAFLTLSQLEKTKFRPSFWN